MSRFTDDDISDAPEGGQLEDKADAGTGDEGLVKRWLLELALSSENEKMYRQRGDKVLKVYSETSKPTSYNILWANIEVLRPNIYGSTPVPDVRRRFKDANPVAKRAAEIMERCIAYQVDVQDFNDVIETVILDNLLPGRGIARLRFEPVIDESEAGDVLSSVLTKIERVVWDRFRRGSATAWEDVPWIAYQHFITKDEMRDKFPGKEFTLDHSLEGSNQSQRDKEPDIFKRATVWEIWDKETKTIIWIHPKNTKTPLLVEDDKLKLKDFFDIPRPLMAIKRPNTLVPKDEFSYYENQARELDLISIRITNLIKGLKLRGLYDSTITEMNEVLRARDGEFIPSKAASIAIKEGGIDRAIWIMPIAEIAQVLAQLYTQREQIKQVIFEIMGLADIMRGSTNPNETLGAQQLKAQTGSIRMRKRQQEVQRFIRDIFRMMGEICVEHIPPDMITKMTGVEVTPEIDALLRDDASRTFNIDVETDSTIAADATAEKQSVTELLTAIGAFAQSITPAIQGGLIDIETAKEVLLAGVRRFDFGRQVEDAIENAEQQQQPQEEGPTPEQLQQQQEQQGQQFAAQEKQAELQAKSQIEQAKIQADVAKTQGELQIKQQELQLKERELQIKEGEFQLKAQEAANGQALTQQEINTTATAEDALVAGAQSTQAIAEALVQSNAQVQEAMQGVSEATQQNAEAIQAIIETLAAPKKIIRNKQGQITGSEIESGGSDHTE